MELTITKEKMLKNWKGAGKEKGDRLLFD